jgi:hypothetical protein
MGSEPNALAERIEAEREELGKDIQEIESRVREEPRRWLEMNLPRLAGAAFGMFFLIGFASARRRHRY